MLDEPLAFTRIHNWVLGYYGLLAPIEAGVVILIVRNLFSKSVSRP
jgi:hypothetical protein